MDSTPSYTIPFANPADMPSTAQSNTLKHAEGKAKSLDGSAYPTGPQQPPAYPEPNHSIHTKAGGYERSNGSTPGLRDELFWQRAAADGLKLTFISFITAYITNMAYIVTKENGTFTQLQYSLFVGLAVTLQLWLSNASVHYLDPLMQAYEIWMKHYSTYILAPFYRVIYWLILLGARFAGYIAAAYFAFFIQVDNTVTHAGLPVVAVGLSLWWAFFIQVIGCLAIGWAFLHAYWNPSAASDVNQSNGHLLVGATFAIVTYLALPYTEGRFDFVRYITTAIASRRWDETGWVYAAGPAGGFGLAALFWYWIYRETHLMMSNIKSD